MIKTVSRHKSKQSYAEGNAVGIDQISMPRLSTPRDFYTPRVAVGVACIRRGLFLRRRPSRRAGIRGLYADGPDKAVGVERHSCSVMFICVCMALVVEVD